MEKLEVSSYFREAGDIGFVMLFVAAWAAVLLFYSMERRLSIPENALVYLLAMTLGIHAMWIIVEELHLMTGTKNGLLYAGMVLYRLVVFPMAFVLMANGIGRASTTAQAFLSIGAALGGLLIVRALMQMYEITVYRQWNMYYDALLILTIQAVCLAALKLYRKLLRREVNAA